MLEVMFRKNLVTGQFERYVFVDEENIVSKDIALVILSDIVTPLILGGDSILATRSDYAKEQENQKNQAIYKHVLEQYPATSVWAKKDGTHILYLSESGFAEISKNEISEYTKVGPCTNSIPCDFYLKQSGYKTL